MAGRGLSPARKAMLAGALSVKTGRKMLEKVGPRVVNVVARGLNDRPARGFGQVSAPWVSNARL